MCLDEIKTALAKSLAGIKGQETQSKNNHVYCIYMYLFYLWFISLQERDGLYQHLHTLELPHYIVLEELTTVQQSWIDGRMTNFDYLTHLNKIAGRSFNDLMQYPIFPFILKDYFSDRLDLSAEKSYRYVRCPHTVGIICRFPLTLCFIPCFKWKKKSFMF